MTSARDRDFELDDFQLRAIEHLDSGMSVLVSAPTGAGKTVIAEHAVDVALASGRRAFYTTPIKALSNQKFQEFRDRLGADRVGLLTGDNMIAADADVVVMTTEVLRNMLYSDTLDASLGAVVLDEVHYLEDSIRGAVWEEVILQLPPTVRLVCLSATVSNHAQLGEWLNSVRGSMAVVVESQRPVPLTDLYAVGRSRSDAVQIMETFANGEPNPMCRRFDMPASPRGRRDRRPWQARLRWRQPKRVDLLAELSGRRLLPAIWFVFSRKRCDQAVARLARDGVRFTSDAEMEQIEEILAARLGGLASEDADALGARGWAASLRLGIAAHHAGMVSAFKETVEECFLAGLIKVVFATETLALGVNMPARSVVIDELAKFDGSRIAPLSPAQYTQLSGRAGRRGIDEMGCVVALWSPHSDFERVAQLAASRSFELRSAFRPTYNMVAGLLNRMSPESARKLLSRSFAQYQAESASEVDLVGQFEAVTAMLRERGHLNGWTLSTSGLSVARIFHECDLVIAEALSAGHFGDLSPPDLASLLSAFTHEHRAAGPRPALAMPSDAANARLNLVVRLHADISECERRHGLSLTKPLDTGFACAAQRWASCEPLGDVLDGAISGGDFVRNVKQVVELARQIAAVSSDAPVAAAARRTVQALDRGVVALSGSV